MKGKAGPRQTSLPRPPHTTPPFPLPLSLSYFLPGRAPHPINAAEGSAAGRDAEPTKNRKTVVPLHQPFLRFPLPSPLSSPLLAPQTTRRQKRVLPHLH
ncbi:hypothetical protein Mapa_010531 [Marchantia paleacea]|nr:hypothetical protein Mapa_010531 [Marchantia paleacea]